MSVEDTLQFRLFVADFKFFFVSTPSTPECVLQCLQPAPNTMNERHKIHKIHKIRHGCAWP